jgi:hypothetical protein
MTPGQIEALLKLGILLVAITVAAVAWASRNVNG